jgi:DNA-directed RNA polymerase specialized sigma24 family protein
MTLVDALRTVAPPAAAATEEEAARRQDALALIYAELQRLARTKGADRDDAEDCASSIALSIAAAGPREASACPPTEAQARGYLATALRNRLIDRYRVQRRLAIPEDLDAFPAPPAPLGQPDMDTLHALLSEAEEVLYDQAVPAIARHSKGRFDRDGFVLAISQLRAIHQESITLDGLLLGMDGAVTATGRNRLYKQHERARTRILEHLPPWLAASALAPNLVEAVRWVATQQLSSRVTHGEEA